MLFSVWTFWVFYAVVLIFIQINYQFIKSENFQNTILLVSSYFFYGYWDWRFLSLIILVSLQTFLFGKLIGLHWENRKFYLAISIFINIIVLGYFKYFNFFSDEFINLFKIESSFTLENIILPIGISFYIFQSLTYVIDIYLKRLKPEERPINYFTYIAFFPQLVAGPIERASSLLPQFKKIHSITSANLYIGIKIIIIGLFLKVFIADSLASDVDYIFQNYHKLGGGTLILGAVYFTIQIYSDFCGYSLIAIGVAKIMGFELMRNFNSPYFSTSIQDFWRRWHISLSSFFRDYIYIPLGGNKLKNKFLVNRNILITFILSGIWHGANWTFILWGLMHGILLILQNTLPSFLHKTIGWLLTMFGVTLLFVLFRSESIIDFCQYISRIIFEIGLPEKRRTSVMFIIYFIIVDVLILKYREQGSVWFNSYLGESAALSIMMILIAGNIRYGSLNFIYFQF